MADHDNALEAALAWAKTNMPAEVGVGVEQPAGSGASTTGTGTGTRTGTAAGEAGAAGPGGTNTQGSGWIVLAEEAYEDVNVSGTLLDGEGELKTWDELGAMEARGRTPSTSSTTSTRAQERTQWAGPGQFEPSADAVDGAIQRRGSEL